MAAATGATGIVREEWPFLCEEGGPTGADKLATFTGPPVSRAHSRNTAPSLLDE